MRIAAQFMLGTKVRGKGGYLGLLHDVLFDDVSWRVRYLVINTRSWLPGRKVILRPGEAQTLDWPAHEIRVDKSRKEIENSPPLAEHEPVSRQRQAELADYFDWSNGGIPISHWAPTQKATHTSVVASTLWATNSAPLTGR
jgi:hypothetical protein